MLKIDFWNGSLTFVMKKQFDSIGLAIADLQKSKMDLREYGLGAQILVDLGLKTICLLTNNPKKVVGLEGYGLEIVKQVPITVKPNRHNKKYLKTKKEKMGHLI